jgi:hypothetical protein
VNKKFLALLIFPVIALAANVFVWNFDPLDRFYDNQVGDTVDCAYGLEQSLAANGHTFNASSNLAPNLDSYDAVFVTLGWYRC